MSKKIMSVIDLCKEVNYLDKCYGVRLKHADAFSNPDMLLEKFMTDTSELFEEWVTLFNSIDVLDFHMSELNWDGDETYPEDSQMFKLRFLTLLLIDLRSTFDKVIKLRFNLEKGKKHSKEERTYLIGKEYLRHIVEFMNAYLKGEDYSDKLLQVLMYTTYSKKSINNPKKYNKQILKVVEELKSGLHESRFSKRFMTDDMAIHDFLRAAYMLSTYDWDCKYLPSFKDIEGATYDCDLSKLIEELGLQIAEERKNFKKRPIIYQAYQYANAEITTSYELYYDDIYLSIGLRSIAYVAFLCNDECVTNACKKILTQRP